LLAHSKDMEIKDCFLLGLITKPHGYKGDVVLFVDADEPIQYRELDSIWVQEESGLVPYFFDSLRPHGDRFVAHLEGVDTEAAAQRLAGSKVFLPEKFLPALADDAFYFHEAIGWTLFDALTKKTVGKIVRVQDHGAYPILEVDAEGLEVLVPLPDHMLMKVDRERGVLEIELPEGLLDVYLNPSEEDVDGNTEEEDPDSFSY
jgi:16S rRNA processing protein RimM